MRDYFPALWPPHSESVARSLEQRLCWSWGLVTGQAGAEQARADSRGRELELDRGLARADSHYTHTKLETTRGV